MDRDAHWQKFIKFSGFFFLGQFYSGAGTAFASIAIEAMADGGVAAGLPREISLSLASQAVSGICADYFFQDCLCWVLDVCFWKQFNISISEDS